MKSGLISAGILAFIILTTAFSLENREGSSAIDIQLYDTYFVIDNRTLAMLSLPLLLFTFSLAAAVSSGFRKKIFNLLFMLSCLGIAGLFVYFRKLFE